tara:strand:- start:3764 stop:4078 length:315 start_codon:yes stop_codon:yes gene_type:complete
LNPDMCCGCSEWFPSDEMVDIPYVGHPTFTMLAYCKPCVRVVKVLADIKKLNAKMAAGNYTVTSYNKDGSFSHCLCGHDPSEIATPEWLYMTELCGCDCASYGA